MITTATSTGMYVHRSLGHENMSRVEERIKLRFGHLPKRKRFSWNKLGMEPEIWLFEMSKDN